MNACHRRAAVVLAMLWVGSASSATVDAEVLKFASGETAERDYLADLPVVLSVSRLAQPLRDTPAAVTVIDREVIRQSGARDVAELFRLVPGFLVGLAPQAPYTVVYHGLTETEPRRMQVLVDGRTQYSAFYYGGVNWNLIPVALDDIERIEVVRGSNSAAYGANAFLGVANIVTRSAAGMPMVTAAALDGQGEARDRMFRGAWDGGAAKLRATFSENADQGIDQFRDSRKRRLIDVRGDFRVGNADELAVRLGRAEYSLEQGFPDRPGVMNSNPARDQKRANEYFQVDWTRALSDGADFRLRYFRTRESSEERAPIRLMGAFLALGNYVDTSYGFTAIRDDLEFTHSLRPASTLRLVWGANWRRDQIMAPHFLNEEPRQTESLYRFFGNLEWLPNERWTLNFGLNSERNTLSEPSLAPRIAANFQASQDLTLRASLSRAYRSPGVLEKRGNEAFVTDRGIVADRTRIPNPSLKAEELVSSEVGILYAGRDPRLSYDARAFEERVRRRMHPYEERGRWPDCELVPVGGGTPGTYCSAANRIENAENARIHGFEHRVDWSPLPGTRLMLSQAFMRVSASLDLPDGTLTPVSNQNTFLTSAARNTAQTRASAPHRATTVFVSQTLPWDTEISAIYSTIGAIQFTSDQNLRNPAYRRLDWRVAKRLKLGPARAEIAFSVQGDGSPRTEYKRDLVLRKRGFLSLRLEY